MLRAGLRRFRHHRIRQRRIDPAVSPIPRPFRPRFFVAFSKSRRRGLTNGGKGRTLAPSSKQQTDDADEYTEVASPRELPVVGWQQKRPRRMDCRGRAERRRAGKRRRAFPPLPRKDACWRVAERTRNRQFGWHRRSFQDFCPKGTIGMGPCRDEGLFLTPSPKGPRMKGETP